MVTLAGPTGTAFLRQMSKTGSNRVCFLKTSPDGVTGDPPSLNSRLHYSCSYTVKREGILEWLRRRVGPKRFQERGRARLSPVLGFACLVALSSTRCITIWAALIPAARLYRHNHMTIYLFTSILSMSNEHGWRGRAVAMSFPNCTTTPVSSEVSAQAFRTA